MDSYIFFLKIYQKYSIKRIVSDIYRHASPFTRAGLWLGKLLFLGAGILQAFALPLPSPWLAPVVGGFALWAVSFVKAKHNYFSSIPGLQAERLKYIWLDFQYVRYELFKREAMNAGRAVEAPEALAFLNTLLDTQHANPIASHPVITITLSVLLAVLGAAASDWPTPIIVGVVFFCVVGLYFSAMILSAITPKEAKTKELKRFLLWLVTDSRSRITHRAHRPCQRLDSRPPTGKPPLPIHGRWRSLAVPC